MYVNYYLYNWWIFIYNLSIIIHIVQLNVKDLTVQNTSSAHGSPLIYIKRGCANFDNLKVFNYNGCADNDNGCINDQNEIIYDRKAVMFDVGEACDLNIFNSYIGYVEMSIYLILINNLI